MLYKGEFLKASKKVVNIELENITYLHLKTLLFHMQISLKI